MRIEVTRGVAARMIREIPDRVSRAHLIYIALQKQKNDGHSCWRQQRRAGARQPQCPRLYPTSAQG